VIEMRRAGLSLDDGLIANEVENLREKWMTHAGEVLEDEQLVATAYEALARWRPKSRSRGRQATPTEVLLRLMILKHELLRSRKSPPPQGTSRSACANRLWPNTRS
jgi:hypothetical protein